MNRCSSWLAVAVALLATVGCTSTSRRSVSDPSDPEDAGVSPDSGTSACVTLEVSCMDGIDNDCDGLLDCDDVDCTAQCNGSSNPEECGDALHSGDTLAIPDGEGVSYETSLTIEGFGTSRLDNLAGFRGACVTMEHSWLRDLQIELICPSGQVVVLQEFLGQEGGELYMGEPNDDDGTDPVPGTGYEYCWRPGATNPPMLEWANANPSSDFFEPTVLPPGDYQASDAFAPMVGCDLNGRWTIRATDDWGIDNGFIFSWSVEFDSSLIGDCSDWVVY